MPITTSSRWGTSTHGNPTRSNRSSAPAGCTAAVPPTTRRGSLCIWRRCGHWEATCRSGSSSWSRERRRSARRHCPTFLDAHRARLAADVIVLADSANWRIGVPALTTSLRGGANVVVEVSTLRHAVHNGLYGGVGARCSHRPGTAAGDAARSSRQRRGRRPVSRRVRPARPHRGRTAGRRRCARRRGTDRNRQPHLPAVDGSRDIRRRHRRARGRGGVDVARPHAPGPSSRCASVRWTTPTPPGPRWSSHLESHAPWGARVKVTAGKAVQPFRADSSGPAYAAARSAFADAWGVATGGDRGRRLDRLRPHLRGGVSATRRSSSRGSRIRTLGRTARTRACTWPTSSAPASPRCSS